MKGKLLTLVDEISANGTEVMLKNNRLRLVRSRQIRLVIVRLRSVSSCLVGFGTKHDCIRLRIQFRKSIVK